MTWQHSAALRTILSTVNVQNFCFLNYLTLTPGDLLLCLYFAQQDNDLIDQWLRAESSGLLTILSTQSVQNCAVPAALAGAPCITL